MALAHAIRDDENLLICDMAETYHIYNYKALPATLLVTLFCGLGPNSRLGRKADGVKVPLDLMLHAAIFDKLALLVHVHEKKGTPPPKSLLSVLLGVDKGENEADVTVKAQSFASASDYEAARRMLLEGVTTNAGG